MPVIAIVNRKGGSGKSTLATHLAAWCAHAGIPTMLGDLDRQQSTQSWLRLREARRLGERAPLVGWAVDPKRVLRPPAGVHHVVLDTPGGLRGFELARVVTFADAIVMPVCNSIFDRESAAECYAELRTLPRVASGRCKVAAVGMRLDGRTRAAEVLADWAAGLGLPFIGVLRETQAYVRCIEQGLTVFDLPPAQVQADRVQWQPLVEWLEPLLVHSAAAALATAQRPSYPCHSTAGGAAPTRKPVAASATDVAAAVAAESTPQPPARDEPAPRRSAIGRSGSLFGWLSMPRFLQRSA